MNVLNVDILYIWETFLLLTPYPHIRHHEYPPPLYTANSNRCTKYLEREVFEPKLLSPTPGAFFDAFLFLWESVVRAQSSLLTWPKFVYLPSHFAGKIPDFSLVETKLGLEPLHLIGWRSVSVNLRSKVFAWFSDVTVGAGCCSVSGLMTLLHFGKICAPWVQWNLFLCFSQTFTVGPVRLGIIPFKLFNLYRNSNDHLHYKLNQCIRNK